MMTDKPITELLPESIPQPRPALTPAQREEAARIAALYDWRTRSNFTSEQRAEALRIGRIEFASAGAVRKDK